MPMSAALDDTSPAHSEGTRNAQVECTALPVAVQHAPHQRRCVQVTDGTDFLRGVRKRVNSHV